MRYFYLFAILSCCFLNCSESPTEENKSHSDTHISSGIIGILTDEDDNPVSGAIVRIYPVEHVPSWGTAKKLSGITDTTDNEGIYEIPNVDTGLYNIEGEKDSVGVFIDSIDVENDTEITDVPTEQLKKLHYHPIGFQKS